MSSKPEEEESSRMAWSIEASVAGSLWRMAVMEPWAVLAVAGYWSGDHITSFLNCDTWRRLWDNRDKPGLFLVNWDTW